MMKISTAPVALSITICFRTSSETELKLELKLEEAKRCYVTTNRAETIVSDCKCII